MAMELFGSDVLQEKFFKGISQKKSETYLWDVFRTGEDLLK